MNENGLKILARASEVVEIRPHIYYGTGPDRFGMVYMDCTGFDGRVYKDATGVRIGSDTGDIFQDVRAGRARFQSVRNLRPGAILMRRSGDIYNGGPDEHAGIFVAYDGDRMWTYESAGSQNGVGRYSRLINWWRDGVEYPILGAPARPLVPEEEMIRIMKDSRPRTPGAPLRFAVGTIVAGRGLDSPAHVNLMRSYRPSPLHDFQEIAVDPILDMDRLLAR